MQNDNVKCQNCGANFNIDADDQSFYAQMKVPQPTWCPECRNTRRFAWREFTTLYHDTCKLCGKKIISIHAPDGPFTIYCRDCWRSDKWDPLAYGREYDFSKPFFRQYREHMEAVPRPALTGTNMINSDYSHASESLKNCYLVFWSYFSEDCQCCFGLLFSRNTFDSWVADNSDHVYEAVHCNRLYNSRFMYYSEDCLDSVFMYDCVGCSSCFGGVNLRKQKYCLFNQQLSKDEYKKQVANWVLGSYVRLQEAREKFKQLVLATPHRHAFITNATNSTGDIIRDAKDCKMCFTVLDGVQNCKYIYTGGLNLKDSMDVTAGGDLSELLYEVSLTTRATSTMFSAGVNNCENVMYSDWVARSAHMFGCISVQDKRYCILNRQYTKAEYETLLPKIIQHMNTMPYEDKKGRIYKFGEFFPTELSAYAYNETIGQSWYPKTKQEVLAEGWQWRDPLERHYHITVKPEDLPDHIQDAKDSLLQEVIGCAHGGTCNEQCTSAFRLTQSELDFYRQMNVALPRLCPNCRLAQRLQWRNGFRLYQRTCARCSRDITTTYAPGRPEIVYCDTCYKHEFL